jgi:hypothetical protein
MFKHLSETRAIKFQVYETKLYSKDYNDISRHWNLAGPTLGSRIQIFLRILMLLHVFKCLFM